jgi:RNA polymerase sigma factor FliA
MMSNSPATLELKYWELWTGSRDADAGNILIQKYMPLVNYHVQRIAVNLPKNISKDELNSLGLVGLLDALNKFDLSRDLKFDTYASFRIKGAIIDGLRKEDWLPRSMREKVKKVEVTYNILEQRLMRQPTTAEIAIETEFTEEEVCKIINESFFASILSIDEQVHDYDEGESHVQMIKDEDTLDPGEQLVKSEWIKELADSITKLNKNEQTVLSLFYHEELTLTEIGEILDLSTSRISQIHSKALLKLKKILSKKS